MYPILYVGNSIIGVFFYYLTQVVEKAVSSKLWRSSKSVGLQMMELVEQKCHNDGHLKCFLLCKTTGEYHVQNKQIKKYKKPRFNALQRASR